MVKVEILQEYRKGDEVISESIFSHPEYNSIFSHISFLAGSPKGEVVHTAIFPNGSPDTFEVFQNDASITKNSENVEVINGHPYINVGVLTAEEPFFLQTTVLKGREVSLFAKVVESD